MPEAHGPGEPPADAPVAGTAAFSKFMRVLQLVADAPQPPSVAALARQSGYPRPTVHRTVAALLAEGLLQDDAGGAGLVLGARLLELASRSWERSGLRRAAAETLAALREQTGETVHLAVPRGSGMVYIDKLESPTAVRMASRIGTRVALHSTAVGKAYLAQLEPAACEALLARLPAPLPRFTPATRTDAAGLRAALAEARARGWAQDDEENEAGIQCFGAAIVARDGMPVAAVSVSTLRFRQRPDVERAYARPLVQACAAISRQLAVLPPAAAELP